MTSPREVVVVGARVAGSATAMLLARMGHDVVMIDRVEPTSDTLSTHALMRTAVLQLERWGILDDIIDEGTPPIRRVTLGFGDQRLSFGFRSEYGVDALYAPRRSVLDTVMLRAALAAGVEFRNGVRALDVTRGDSGRVDGVITESSGSTSTIAARHVIGADGARSRIATAVGAEAYRSHRALNTVIYGYFDGVEGDGYEFQFTPGCSAGLIPTNDGLTNVFAAYPRDAHGGDTEAIFDHVLEAASSDLSERVRAGSRVERFRRGSIPGFVRVPGGPGWALVGDSGFTKDPISAHGISDAFRDAELVAAAVHRSLLDPRSETSAMIHYQTTRDRFALPVFDHSEALATYTWDEAEASTRLRALSDITDDECRHLVGLAPVQHAA